MLEVYEISSRTTSETARSLAVSVGAALPDDDERPLAVYTTAVQGDDARGRETHLLAARMHHDPDSGVFVTGFTETHVGALWRHVTPHRDVLAELEALRTRAAAEGVPWTVSS